MRVETTTRNLYKFEELDQETKQKAIDGLYDINVDHEWWDCTYEDAEQIGLKITEFDIDRGQYVKASFTETAELSASSIVESHGPDCETYKTAAEYLSERREILRTEENHDPDEANHDDLLEDLDAELLKSLSEDYRRMLTREYEYLTTEEAIIETIESNDYEFDGNGKLA